ncbi:MAG: hypothetical protein PF450_01545, partial [Bacteroidales bacterium]|nr:hypothetical protein [Bacteroidales bacterium]
INTATSPVKNQPALINIVGTDIGAWWQPETQPLGQYSFASQGAGKVGMLKIKAWTDNFVGIISGFKIIKSGSGSGADVQSMRVYLDASGGDWTLGDDIFSPFVDMEITDTFNPPTHDPDDTESFKLTFDQQSYGEIGISTKTFFIAYDFSSDAIEGLSHGASLEKAGIMLIGADVPSSLATINSSVVPIIATSDTVKLVAMNRVLPNDFSKPTSVTQNDVNKTIARLTITVDDFNGSAIWKGLKLDRWLTDAENSGNPLYNKASDVSKINLWYDSTGDGLLQTTTTVKDTEVVLLAVGGRQFPINTIASPITAAATEMEVDDIQKYFPSDSPFDMAPGRLIINDEQTDSTLKEIIYYSTVNVLNNTFGGLTRGAEGTVAMAWSSGTYVSGQAVLPLIGEGGSLDGQVIYDSEKDYFVTFDIDPLATVSKNAYIGLSIRSSDYFKIVYPKSMAEDNIGPTASSSFVGKIEEYADKILIVATETVTGNTLQQKNEDQAILSFSAESDMSDSMFRWMMVYATGSVISEGSAMNDVSQVKVWLDADDNGFLGTVNDVVIGTGTFGNTIYGALVSRINLFSDIRVTTQEQAKIENIPQRYFISYDIKDSAAPNDTYGNPRYLGAYLKEESFPMGSPSAPSVEKNSFSLPNMYDDSSELPFFSKLREVISSPSTVTVITEPIFATAVSG